MIELAAKNQEGQLTPAEQEELDNYLKVADLLALLQSKIRARLRKEQKPVDQLSATAAAESAPRPCGCPLTQSLGASPRKTPAPSCIRPAVRYSRCFPTKHP